MRCLPGVLDVGVKGVRVDVIDQRRSERVGDEVTVPSGDLRRMVHQPQQRGIGITPAVNSCSCEQAVCSDGR